MIKAKKSLGQNFLTSSAITDTIVFTARVDASDTVLEIGPGKGILTTSLLATGAKVIAVEKDGRLIRHLREKFAAKVKAKQLLLIHADILDLKPDDLFLRRGSYKLVANIPYYITGQVVRNFLSTDTQPSQVVLMLQKEVAERVVARDGKESLLSISVKLYGEPRYVKTIPRTYFDPSPKVDSAILMIENISKNKFKGILENNVFALLKRGFGSKRKMLKNNLDVDPEVLLTCGIPATIRAEKVTVNQWLCLAKHVS